jgi:hypothetical protein
MQAKVDTNRAQHNELRCRTADYSRDCTTPKDLVINVCYQCFNSCEDFFEHCSIG